jgi:hypothetical protein
LSRYRVSVRYSWCWTRVGRMTGSIVIYHYLSIVSVISAVVHLCE